jgi:hypothetical protein
MNEPSPIDCRSQNGSAFSHDEMLTDCFNMDGNPPAPDLNLDDLIPDIRAFSGPGQYTFSNQPNSRRVHRRS